MYRSFLKNVFLNFTAILLLGALIATPIYFVKNFAKVAGVKNESAYLLISQVEKFPQMKLSQIGNVYTLSLTKQASKQAYQSVFILNNPTNETKTYQILNQSELNIAFFGENITKTQTKIVLPAKTSASISILSNNNELDTSLSFSLEAI